MSPGSSVIMALIEHRYVYVSPRIAVLRMRSLTQVSLFAQGPGRGIRHRMTLVARYIHRN